MIGKIELMAPCHFGMESVLKKELYDLGYNVTKVTDGRVYFEGDAEAVCYANVFLRTAERVLINVGEFKAETFEELFQGTKAIEWENYIPEDAKFNVVKAASVKSKLFSPTDIQKIMKKAMVDRLGTYYKRSHFEKTGIEFAIRVMINKDIVSVGLDTTGTSLHKRGYRLLTAKAPIAENLAAAIIMLSPWREDRILVDPFCGSGTFPIEAALIGANIAPGINRKFSAMEWKHLIDSKVWSDCKSEARERIVVPDKMDIQGYDIDPEMIEIARENARKAGVDKYIHFQTRDVKDLSHHKKFGFIITNPPYGERLMDNEIVEDGKSFEENSLIKARSLREEYLKQKRDGVQSYVNVYFFADDSGLEVDALNKEPGVLSARYMGEDTSYHIKNQNIIDRLEGVEEKDRTARFVCAFSSVDLEGNEKVVRETMEGYIGYKEAGENGFGYDPIFMLPEYGCTSSEISMEEKNKISHRGKALRKMMEILTK